jgi:hypothetical protein
MWQGPYNVPPALHGTDLSSSSKISLTGTIRIGLWRSRFINRLYRVGCCQQVRCGWLVPLQPAAAVRSPKSLQDLQLAAAAAPLTRLVLHGHAAGGPLQHAHSLLSLTSSTGVLGSSSSSSSTGATGGSSRSGPVLSQAAGRSISTTRGIYMGR